MSERLPPGLKQQYGIKNRMELDTLIYKKSKQLNQRFYRLEKKKAGLKEAAYYYAQKETGMQKPRYTVNKDKIKAMNTSQAYAQLLKIDKKLKSDTSTLRGLKGLAKRRIDAQMDVIKQYHDALSVTDRQWIAFLESGGGELLNRYMDSQQLIEDWMRNLKEGISSKDFIKTYNKFMDDTNEPFDLGKVDRALKDLNARKRLDKIEELAKWHGANQGEEYTKFMNYVNELLENNPDELTYDLIKDVERKLVKKDKTIRAQDKKGRKKKA